MSRRERRASGSRLPVAHVVHSCASRMRLSVPDMKGQEGPLTTLCDSLLKLKGVRQAEARLLTGSLIVSHEDATEGLIRRILDAQLLDICEAEAEHDPAAEAKAWQARADSFLAELSGKGVNLRGLAAFAFFAMALRQIAAGHVLPPAATALWYGLSLLLLGGAAPAGDTGEGE